MSEKIDYQAEGLLDGVIDEAGREARTRLLDYLVETEKVPLDELKLAAQENRLVLLPLERALGGDPQYTAAEVAEKAGVELKLFLELRRSLGLAELGGEARTFSEYDIATMRAVRANIELGMSMESIREINRVLGAAMSGLAATVERQFLATFLNPEDDEHGIAVRYGEVARITSPEFGFVLQHIFNLHLREATRNDILGSEATFDLLSDTRQVAIGFADLVGFTNLGEQIPADELGAIAERLNEVAVSVVEPPVRLVKMIGDAVMLASPEPAPLIDQILKMIDLIDQEDEGFPRLSAGVEFGEALARGGDFYGPPVNHASRLTDAARPGALLASGKLQEMFPDEYDWTDVGRRRFKGIEKPIALKRVRAKGDRAKARKARSQ